MILQMIQLGFIVHLYHQIMIKNIANLKTKQPQVTKNQLLSDKKQKLYQPQTIINKSSEYQNHKYQNYICQVFKPVQNTDQAISQPKQDQIQKNSIIRAFDLVHNPSSINFRTQQCSEISSFIQEAIKDKLKCRCLLLTGMPGAGKTSLAKKILQNTAGIRYIIMNANILMADFVMEFSHKLVGSKLRLNQLITYLQKRKPYQKVFVLVDEFDSLFKNASSQCLDLFRVFCQPIQHVSLIATSNSMQMMQTLSIKYNTSLPIFKNIVFKQYGTEQIKNIILQRVKQVKLIIDFDVQFEQLVLKYCAAKIYNFKGGDIRFVLDQVKQIVTKSLDRNSNRNNCKVSFEAASSVLTKFNKSHQTSDIMKNLPFQQSLSLIALYKLFEKNQYLQVSTEDIQKQIQKVKKVIYIDRPQINLMDLLRYLQVYGFVKIREKKKKTYVSLKTSTQIIKNAYEDDALLGRYFWQ